MDLGREIVKMLCMKIEGCQKEFKPKLKGKTPKMIQKANVMRTLGRKPARHPKGFGEGGLASITEMN